MTLKKLITVFERKFGHKAKKEEKIELAKNAGVKVSPCPWHGYYHMGVDGHCYSKMPLPDSSNHVFCFWKK